MKDIELKTHDGRTITIPNSWNGLSPELFTSIVNNLAKYASGQLSKRELLIMYVAEYLGIELSHLSTTEAENLYLLSEDVSFLFKGEDIRHTFCAQLIPEVNIQGREYTGYQINYSFGALTCSLSAAQFIEAYSMISCDESKYPLIAAILYTHPYSAALAHQRAEIFAKLDKDTLRAIHFNFRAFVSFLFSNTMFSILSSGSNKKENLFSVSMADALYDLSADGLGDSEQIEKMDVIKYLRILRKKLIESIRTMHSSEVSITDIADKTGLPTQTIKKIVSC